MSQSVEISRDIHIIIHRMILAMVTLSLIGMENAPSSRYHDTVKHGTSIF